MNEHVSVITRKGQVTVPADLRHRLGLKHGDNVRFELQDNRVVLTPTHSVVSATAGSFRSEQPAMTAEELRAAAEKAIAGGGRGAR